MGSRSDFRRHQAAGQVDLPKNFAGAIPMRDGLAEERQRKQAIDAEIARTANGIYQTMAADLILSAIHGGENLTGDHFRSLAQAARNAAPYLLETFGLIQVQDNKAADEAADDDAVLPLGVPEEAPQPESPIILA